MYTVRGRTGQAALGLSQEALAALWNPHATQRIHVVGVSLFQAVSPASGRDVQLIRISARGTPGSTVTPDIPNHNRVGSAPPSGAVLDLAPYSVQPTIDGVGLDGLLLTIPQGDGWMFFFERPIVIPPNAGLAFAKGQNVGTVEPCEVSFFWVEDS